MGNSKSRSSNAKRNKPVYTDTPPKYTETIDKNSQLIQNNSLIYTISDEKTAEEDFRARMRAVNESSSSFYVDDIINSSIMENVISPYDPYILMLANKYCDRSIVGEGISAEKLIGINIIKQYIKYHITGIDDKIEIEPIACGPGDIDIIEELCPEHYNVIKVWRMIITMNILYMNMWNDNGALRKIFGDKCEPFPLRFVATHSPIDHSEIYCFSAKYYYDYIEGNGYYDHIELSRGIIKRRYDSLPDFESVRDVIVKSDNMRKFYFYIGSDDLKKYINRRKKTIKNRKNQTD